MHDQEGPEQKAIRLLNRQLDDLRGTISALSATENPKFKAWRDTTRGVLERFLGKESHHTTRFVSTRFFSMTTIAYDPYGSIPPGHVSPEDLRAFQDGCRTAEETLMAVSGRLKTLAFTSSSPSSRSVGEAELAA